MKILLVKPQARLPTILGLQRFQLLEPLELGYLAAAVGPRHEVRILDLRLALRADLALIRALREMSPDLVGLTGYTHESSIVSRLARMVRERLPRATVVVGGHHATVEPGDFNRPFIDFIVRGEGCVPFAAIVAALARGERPGGIDGVLTAGADYDPTAATRWPTFPDPAVLPTPRRDLWNPERYRSVWAAESMKPWTSIFPRVATVRSSFGCKMKCSFCIVPHLSGGRHQPRPVEQVVDEIACAPADHIYFSDDENFIDEGFAWALADGLERRGVRKRYFAWTRSTTVNRSPELLRRWRAIGLDAAFLGFEFPTDHELKAVGKGGNVAANERALDGLRAMGIAVHAAFMVQPDYSHDEFARLRRYVRALPPSQSSFTVCTPSPGTPDYERMRSDFWVPNPHDLHDCMHPLTPTRIPLREFSRLFADQVREGIARTPLRVARHPIPPRDIWRVWRAETAYYGGFRRIYRDFPRALWNLRSATGPGVGTRAGGQ
jgi:hopanoid C-3 methylase